MPEAFYTQYLNTDAFNGKERLVELYSDYLYVVQNPPELPLTEIEMDDICSTALYEKVSSFLRGTWRVPAIPRSGSASSATGAVLADMRFCALTFHQGRIIQTRSHQSLLDEARQITKEKDFKRTHHDVGGLELPISGILH